MKVTSVNVKKIEKDGSRMKGIASILLDDLIAIHDIRIIQGDARESTSYSRPSPMGQRFDHRGHEDSG